MECSNEPFSIISFLFDCQAICGSEKETGTRKEIRSQAASQSAMK